MRKRNPYPQFYEKLMALVGTVVTVTIEKLNKGYFSVTGVLEYTGFPYFQIQLIGLKKFPFTAVCNFTVSVVANVKKSVIILKNSNITTEKDFHAINPFGLYTGIEYASAALGKITEITVNNTYLKSYSSFLKIEGKLKINKNVWYIQSPNFLVQVFFTNDNISYITEFTKMRIYINI